MGIFSKFERGIEDGLEGAANKMFDAPISPVQISKKAERAMRREKMVGAGKQYAPTLYTILVNPEDDQRLFGYYPTLAGETETFLSARAAEEGLVMDGQPLVRFIVDESLKRGKFDVIAELVSAPIVAQLRREEMQRYGLLGSNGQSGAQARPQQSARQAVGQAAAQQASQRAAAKPTIESQQIPNPIPSQRFSSPQAADNLADLDALDSPDDVEDAEDSTAAAKQPLPYVPEEEIDRTIDYGEYTFNSQDFEDYEEHGPSTQLVSEPVEQDVPTSYTSEELKATYDAYEDDADLSGFDVEVYVPGAFDSREIRDVPSTAAATTAFTSADPAAQPSHDAAFARLKDLSANRTYELASSRIIMGRSHSCDIVVDDINASRSHAELRHEAAGEWIITDLGSTNGTTVNGERITSHLLAEGDRISIGTTEFVFL